MAFFIVSAALFISGSVAEEVGVRRSVRIAPHRPDELHVQANGGVKRNSHRANQHDSSNRELLSRRQPEPRPGAAFGVLVHPDGVWGHQKTGSLIGSAATLICSARLQGSTMPFHLIYGGGESEQNLNVLRTLGWTIDDHTADIAFWKSNYKPVYNASAAKQQKRRWMDKISAYVQPREDGWATYFKFHTWQATSYKHVLLVDLDVLFTANPDVILSNVNPNVEFQASPESHFFDGLNTHMAIIRPSNDTFRELVQKAHTGDYVPYTNTEQDILEDRFPPKKGYVVPDGIGNMFPHIHGLVNFRHKCDDSAWKTWMGNLLEVEPSCADLKPICPM